MLIHDMTRQASIDLLARARLCRVAYVHEGQPYIVPMCCAYDKNYLYCFSTHGQKTIWMRANPLVCVEADEVTSLHDWATVVVLGKYEELPDTPEYLELRKFAHVLLQGRPMWWEPAYVKTVLGEKTRPIDPVYFRIHIEQVSGHRGVPNSTSGEKQISTDERSAGWFRRIMRNPKRQKRYR